MTIVRRLLVAGVLGALVLLADGAPASARAAVPAAGAMRATLSVASTRAPVGTEVPFMLTVTPAAAAAHHGVRVQVMDRNGVWVTIDGYRLPRSAVLRDTLTGIEPGLGRYRAIVLGTGAVLATSNTVSVSWTAPTG